MDNRDNRTQDISGEPSRLLTLRMHGQPRVEEFPDLAPGLVMSTFHARPVWGGMAWRRAFPGRADQSAPARRMVGQLLADTGRREDAEWVTAELISNALRHSCSGHSCSGQARGFFVVEVLRGAEVARIVVYDLGGGSSPDLSGMEGSIPESAEQGRGLAGVREVAVRVGVAGDAVTGHAVWADLDITEDAALAALAGTASSDSADGRKLGDAQVPEPAPRLGFGSQEEGAGLDPSGLVREGR